MVKLVWGFLLGRGLFSYAVVGVFDPWILSPLRVFFVTAVEIQGGCS